MRFLKYLLLPFQIIYSIVILIRNSLYDLNIFTTHKMSPIIISVGNIKNGGTGKTPLVEYLIRLFQNNKIAILSRGYGRRTTGFILANEKQNEAQHIGDENSQLYNKFKNIEIGCQKNRVKGVKELLKQRKEINIVILDDGYQHRKIHRDINILLTEYDKPLSNDYLMPIGKLREHKREIKRADIVIITKCPEEISKNKQNEIIESLNLRHNQKVYFSYIKKYIFKNMHSLTTCEINKSEEHILLTGIEGPEKLLEFLSAKKINTHHLRFKDHYNFKESDIKKIMNLKKLHYSKELLLTEKDYYRLSTDHLQILKEHFILICIQIEIDFIDDDKSYFNNQLLKLAN